MKKLLFLLTMLIPVAVSGQGIAGSWNGELDLGTAELRIAFHIQAAKQGYVAEMDSPDQGAFGIPMTTADFSGGTLRITSAEMGMTYEGVLMGNLINGTLERGGMKFPLNLKRGRIAVARPQEPVPPFPYESEDVTFENPGAGIRLAGTLTMPATGGRFPAVVMIAGSGAQNRDEELLSHKPFLVIADHLSRSGIAVLRYDDRGVAQSEGDYAAATIQDFAGDAMAAVGYLRTRTEIDPDRIGLIGHSEGGTVAFMIAGGGNGVAFIVSMAGSVLPGDELMRLQRSMIYDAMNLTPAMAAQNEELVERMMAIVEREGAEPVRADALRYATELLPPGMESNEAAQSQLAAELRRIASPELQSFLKYDAGGDLAAIGCPVLAINGGKDLQVPAAPNFAVMRERIKSPLTVKEYPGLNHLFQHCTTGLPGEYGTIEETVSPEVLNDIATWILNTTGQYPK